MSSDAAESQTEDDDRDAALLRQLVLARKRPDGVLREQAILAELLGRHARNIRRIAAYRAYSLRPSAPDLDEIVNAVFIRVTNALECKLGFGKPFRYVVADNL